MPEPVKFQPKQPKFVCLKHIESFKPGAVVTRTVLPATADMDFLLGTGALREATPEECAKEAVDINPKNVADAATRQIADLQKQLAYKEANEHKLQSELQKIKMAEVPINDLAKTLQNRDAEIAALNTKLAQANEALQKAKEAAASTPKP